MFYVPLGIGDAFSQNYYSSCLYLEHEGYKILIDCSHPIRKIMKEASFSSGINITADKIDAVILTHLHGDHCSGLEGLAFYARYVSNQGRITLAAHDSILEDIWDHVLGYSLGPFSQPLENRRKIEDFFKLVSLKEDKYVNLGPFSVICHRNIHHVPTYALKISDSVKVLGCSADTAFDPGLIEWLQDADKIIHETNLGSHTPYEKLCQLPEEIRKKMQIIHYPDDFDTASSLIEPLCQGKMYTLK